MESINEPVAWIDKQELEWMQNHHLGEAVVINHQEDEDDIPLYTHPVKEQDDYCKAYWGNDNKFVDVFLPNSETEVIRFWNNTHPVKELTDEEILDVWDEDCVVLDEDKLVIRFARAILRKAQEK